jgi:CO/xanthine dehydrogenase Mo-binding subunit
MTKFKIGDSCSRVDLSPKLSGQARYIDDVTLPDMLFGMTLRSSIPRGQIKQIQLPDHFEENGFIVASATDIPGANVVRILNDDQPLLALDEIHHAMEPLLLVAHANREALLEFMDEIEVKEEAWEPVLDLNQSMHGNLVVHRDGNLLKEIRIEKGEPQAILGQGEIVVEGTFHTGAQEHAYIEPNGIIAWIEDGRICVRGSMQCPYYVQGALCEIFGREASEIRVLQDTTGGAFGGKEDYPSILAAHAALLALKSGRPVKMIYDRSEDMAATTKRHPSTSTIRAAFSPDGILLAQDLEFNLDAGAFTTLTPVVLSRGALHASGPYRCDHTHIRAKAWATNTPPHGAFRGFGAPQSCFAIEGIMDQAAAKLGLDPAEIRRRNFLKKGDAMATGQIVQEDIDLEGLLNQALEHSGYKAKRMAHLKHNQHVDPDSPRRGIGLSSFFHGAGFTGSGEKLLKSKLAIEVQRDGRVMILAASTEMGQGSTTVFTQILSDVLGLDPALIEVAAPDTDKVPNSGPTVASRTSMVIGSLIRDAGLDLLKHLQINHKDCLKQEGVPATLLALAQSGPVRFERTYQHPEWIKWDETIYKGDAYPTFAWAVYVAETEVDPVTAEVRVLSFHALQDIGRVINPQLAEGQVEGGVAQGIGFALLEQVVWHNGQMINNSLSDYIIPTFMDLPTIRAHFRESPWGYGPGGAKGLGELPMDGSAPAIACALNQACGFLTNSLPILPEHLLPIMDGLKQ